MNSTKIRQIILEELSASRRESNYRRPRKLGLVDFLGESSQNLLELDDGVIVSTGRSIFEQDLGGNNFDVTTAGEPTESDVGSDAASGAPAPSNDASPHQSPPDSNDASTEDDPDEEMRKSAEAAAADAKAREEEVGARTDPASPTAAPEAPAADPTAQGGGDSDGEEGHETHDDPDTNIGGQDSEGSELPPSETQTQTAAQPDDDDHDSANSAVVSYIDSVSDAADAHVSESRVSRLSLVDALYVD
jgi:hypothetical protein